jgi:hypothetical protein
VNGRTVGGDLSRDGAGAQRSAEEAPRGRQVVDESAVPGSVAGRPGRLDELRSEPLHPPLDGDVIDGDTALGQ